MHIRERANFFTDGLRESEARGGLTPEDPFKPSDSKCIFISVTRVSKENI